MEDALSASVWQAVLAKTEAADCARAACVNRRWRSLAYDDSLWSQHCNQSFGVSTPSDPDGQPCCSFKETYAAWLNKFEQYGSLVYRTKKCWDDLREFFRAKYPIVAESFRLPASEADIGEAERSLGWEFPKHVRLIYRFCDGQEIVDRSDNVQHYMGLFGGYYFYNHFVNVQFLSLSQVVAYTRRLSSRFPPGTKRIVVAASCSLNKFFAVDCDDGMMYVGTKNFLEHGEVVPCVPPSNGSKVPDAMLRWLEEYRDRLLSGTYKIRNDEGMRSISLFPEKEPLCTETVTNGVQVRCSSVFVPELSVPFANGDKFVFAYCVRMRYLPVRGNAFQQCQLSRRHWIISAEDEVVDEVRGEAVVGMYPLLNGGGDVFVYESCSSQKSRSGSMEGDFTFVPGSLSKQEGPEFCARIAPFPLQVPEYIF